MGGALHPGQMLAGTSYQVLREIGAGGMGVVYEVEHVRLKKRYVAKIIHEQIKDEDGALKRMEREAQVLASLSHPNVVQVHDFGSADGVTYFIMEKLEGVDLRRSMKRGVRRSRAIGIIADVLEALAYVHGRGIVHRDIKPENIFLAKQPSSAGGTVTKVLDFGIVSIVDGEGGRLSQQGGRITKTGGFVGTLHYAAPEQMQGKSPGPPTDVYAAGLVLFELLAGKGPFDDDPGVGLSRCFKPAPLLSEVVLRTPTELSDVVARALEQDPDKRPPASVLAAQLRDVGAMLKTLPAEASGEDDDVRAEVDDLLAHLGTEGDGEVPQTSVPATPVMAGAPPRVGFDPTMASPQHNLAVAPTAAAPSAPNNAIVAAAATMSSPQRISSPDPPALAVDPHATPQPPQPPLPPRMLGTTPGVYATIDISPPSSSSEPQQRGVSWTAVVMISGGLLLTAMLFTGAIVWRSMKPTAAASVTTQPASTASTPTPTATTSAAAAMAAEPVAPVTASSSSAPIMIEPTTKPAIKPPAIGAAPNPPKPTPSGRRAAQDGYTNEF